VHDVKGWKLEDLPKPTEDCKEARSNIDRWGYCLLDKAIPKDLLSRCIDRLIEQAEAEKALGIAFEDGGPNQQWGDFTDKTGKPRSIAFRKSSGGVNQRVWMLVNKGQPFLEVLELKKLISMVRYVLGKRFILSSYTANIARPGGVPMPLHTDQWWAPEPVKRGENYLPVGSINRETFRLDKDIRADSEMLAPPSVSNVLIMLDGMNEKNGGTCIVPCSHLKGRHPDSSVDSLVESVSAEGPPGCAIITDGRIWHGTGANHSDFERKAILLTFCGPQYRPQENYTIGTSPEVLSGASNWLKELLGFRVWCGYGRTGDPIVDYVNPRDKLIGELSTK